MRRSLVLTHEGAGHPFRRSLPSHVFKPPVEKRAARGKAHLNDDQDWKLFALSFAAFFTVAYTFIA